jgi:hypothetical protein
VLTEGVGDAIRVSLSAPPVEEVKVDIGVLEIIWVCGNGTWKSSRVLAVVVPRWTSMVPAKLILVCRAATARAGFSSRVEW